MGRTEPDRFTRFIILPVTFLLGVALTSAPVAAQETGAVEGRVTRATGQPLSGAQLVVVGTRLGTIADQEGRFRIEEVPAGEQTLRVQMVGYGTKQRSVQIQAGQLATVNFSLQQSAVELDEIVVTGTGTGGVERKRLGNTIASINTQAIENSPTQSVSEMLSAREPGVNVLPSSGLAGEGAAIRIRGSGSITQSNEPLIYIDGIRVGSGGTFAGPVSGGSAGVGASSRLDDLNPESIARIEVLKGAAAATLYGTEASNGVIQIFTKSGREGPPRWTFEVEQGLEFMPTNRTIPYADFAGPGTRPFRSSTEQQLQTLREFWGFEGVQPYEVVQKDLYPQIAETGRVTTVSGQVNGGSSGVTYFLSGRYQNHDGVFGLEDLGPARDHNVRYQGSANVDVVPSDVLRVRLRTNFARTNQETPQSSNTPFGPQTLFHTNVLTLASERNQFGVPVFATIQENMQQTTTQEINHYAASVRTAYQPGAGLTLNVTTGIDFSTNDSESQLPFGWNVDDFATIFTQGQRSAATRTNSTITAEIRSGWDESFGDFTSTLTLGTQGFLKQQKEKGSTGVNFPGPGLEVTSAAGQQEAFETFRQNVNIGLFAQEQVGWRDFAFLTVGGRWDVNSAFGETLAGQFYPKVSASVVPSDLSMWDSELVSSLRVRGAWGQSGLQPGAFDKFRTFSSLPTPEGPGIATDNLGNPEIKPEVSTEVEAGVELGLFGDRASLSATVWDRQVDDLLIAKQFPVSGGFENLQLANVGEMEAQGLDLSLSGMVLTGDDYSVELFGNAAYLDEEVIDMGGAPSLKTGGSYPRNRNFIKEGFAPGALFGAEPQDVAIPLDLRNTCSQPSREEALAFFSQPRSVDDFEVLAKDCGTAQMTEQYKGKPLPDWSGSFGTTINLFGNLTVSSLWEYKAGNFVVQDLTGAFRQSSPSIGRNIPQTAQVQSTLLNPESTAEERLDAAITWATELEAVAPFSGMNSIHPADYLRWRELSVTYDVPEATAQALSLGNVTLSLRARNIAISVNDAYTGLSPELNANGRCVEGSIDCNFLLGQEVARIPIPRRFLFAVRVGF